MEYIRIKNNIIVDLVSCSEKPAGDWKEVNLEGGLHVGDDIRMFDSSWSLRPEAELIKDGLLQPEPEPEPEPEPVDPAVAVRAQRDVLLSELDFIVSNPLRWSGFTDNQKETYAVYRQQLLDVPQQKSFPHEVVWPEKPK